MATGGHRHGSLGSLPSGYRERPQVKVPPEELGRVGMKIPCPHCGEREFGEFTFGGELRPIDAPDPGADFARVFLRENAPGRQAERWFHAFGCRRWLTLERDTVSNRIG